MDKAARNRARPRVQVLVTAPDGKVGVRVVQMNRQVSYRMRKVEADECTRRMSKPGDLGDVIRFTRSVLDAWPHHHGKSFAIGVNGTRDRCHRDRAVWAVGHEFDQRRRRVYAAKAQL